MDENSCCLSENIIFGIERNLGGKVNEVEKVKSFKRVSV
jgi:hypothetical protein